MIKKENLTTENLITDELLDQFKNGDDLYSFIDTIRKRGIERILEGEMDAHLDYEKHARTDNPNARNGHSTKIIKTESGKTQIKVPRDRDSTFDPILVPKRKGMADGVEKVIVSLYSRGMSNRDIEDQIRDIYGINTSAATISRITDSVKEDIVAWQNRPLEPIYLIVWMDGIVFKVREGSKIINKTIYLAIGLREDGHREVMGLWLGLNESASFWSGVLTDMKVRGVQDVMITATDNLTGFTDAIRTTFPKCQTQICVVHQIRNSCRYVAWRDRKALAGDMKHIYTAPNEEAAHMALNDFKKNWNEKYPHAVNGWENNWDDLTIFLGFPVEIRKIIYTTNLIENLNRQVRKYTKSKTSFPTNDAVTKSVYLSILEATKRWTRPIPDFPLIYGQFILHFPDRMANLVK